MVLPSRKLLRYKYHDYNGGAYFITIDTKERVYYFGEVVCNSAKEVLMELTEIGRYVEECIKKIETLHKEVYVPVYVIMPNHIHAIIIIETANLLPSSTPNVRSPYYDDHTSGVLGDSRYRESSSSTPNVRSPYYDDHTSGVLGDGRYR